MEFVVRNIPASTTSLDGAFRVHLAPESLSQAGLVFNEPCEILVDSKVVGFGISWRAADKMGASPKTRPARMSEILRDAYGIKEGSQVVLRPTASRIQVAETLTLTELSSPQEPKAVNDVADGDTWRTRCAFTLCNAEAIARGTTFEVAAKKGAKRRYVIDSIRKSGSSGDRSRLYRVSDATQLVFGTDDAEHSDSALMSSTNKHIEFQPLSTDGIGGLIEQIEALNTSIRAVLQQARDDAVSTGIRRNWPIVLHGYEGTGKSLLLRRLAKAGFRKTLHLNKDVLEGNVASKKKTIITDTFSEARTQQPSLIVMDDLNRLAPAEDDTPYLGTLCDELDSVAGTKVLVVAATRSLQDVHRELLGPDRFIRRIELPIPDLKAREQVLLALSVSHGTSIPDVAALSSRTHGFTFRDLAELASIARMHAFDRSMSNPPDLTTNGTNGDITPGTDPSAATISATLHDSDWQHALNHVRPAALRQIIFSTPKVAWSDIGGSLPVRTHLDEIIGWPLHHAAAMKRFRLAAQKGMLLYGPPGCSKTLTAQAVAANYAMNFIAVKGAELISMYVGESERAVREIFRKARTARPCVVFFDEIDSIASEREVGGTKGLNVLTTLLNEMDGFEALEGVFVLAATNKPEVLDPAIMRPGRFDQHLYLPPPNDAARREILELHISSSGAKGEDLDIDRLVKETAGYSGAEVVAVSNLAKRSAFRRMLASQGEESVRIEDFEVALREVPPRITEEMLAGYEAFGRR